MHVSFIFHKVVYRRIYDVVRHMIITLLQIVQCVSERILKIGH